MRLGFVCTVITPSQTGDVVARGTLSVPGSARAYPLRRVRRRVRSGGRYPIRVRIPRDARSAALRALRRGRRVRARVSVAVRGRDGRERSIVRSLTAAG